MIDNIIIIEDNPESGRWLETLVSKAFPDAQIELCNDCRSAEQYLTTNKPGLALLDINLPDGTGLDLIRPILKTSPSAYIVMVTILDDQEHIYQAIRYGAKGYLLKDLPEELFLPKLQGILAGEPPLSPSVARVILQRCAELSNDTQSTEQTEEIVTPDTLEEALTNKETEVLQIIARGYSRKETANFLSVSENTIATHIRGIYRKLGISSRAEAATVAARMKLMSIEAS